jgi:glycosyltransferase involved in cell wall biosynthesis
LSLEPLVTIVSPLYNGERHVRGLAECVLAQTYANWRLVIVDNHSKDGTNALASEYAARDERVRVVRNPETVDVISNHNVGFREITPGSAYFRFLQADDRLNRDALAKGVTLAEAYPRVGIVGSHLKWGEETTSTEFDPAVLVHSGREVAARTLLGETYPCLTPSGLLFRMDAVRHRQPFFKPEYLYADVMAFYEVLREWDFGLVPEVLTVVGRDTGSVTNVMTKSFNRMFASNLHLLTLYGPEFIDDSRYQQRLDARLQLYYEYLGRSWFDLRRPGFWEFHAAGFRTCGLTLEKPRVRREAMRFLRSDPEAAIRAVARNLRDGRS